MYKINDINWLPKPNKFKFVKRKLNDYKYTSAIVFVIQNNRVLLVNVKSRGWDFVSGRIEKDETIKECARREFLEETGYSVKKLKFIGSHKMDCETNPKGCKTAQAIYLGLLNKKETDQLESDIIEQGWYSVHELSQFNFPEWKIKLIKYAISCNESFNQKT